MSDGTSQEELLRTVLERVRQNNLQARPGTPMAELKSAIEAAIATLPPLQFEELSRALEDSDAASKLVEQGPEMVGWTADQLVEWVEQLGRKIITTR